MTDTPPQSAGETPAAPPDPWAQLYQMIRALRIVVDSDAIVPMILAELDAALATERQHHAARLAEKDAQHEAWEQRSVNEVMRLSRDLTAARADIARLTEVEAVLRPPAQSYNRTLKRAEAAEASLLALQQQMEAIEAVVRQEFCPQENSDPDGYPDDEPVPAYVSMSEDGVPIIEADALADVVRAVAGLFTRLEERHEKLQQRIAGLQPYTKHRFDCDADASGIDNPRCTCGLAAHLTGGPA